jgi:twitching motility protein PilT
VLVVTNAVRALVREGKTHQIYSSMQAGGSHGMQTMNQSLLQLYMAGLVTREEIFTACEDSVELERMVNQATAGR